ncbi:MAG TPA: hypothetical protein VFH97_00435 [Gemmatimonadales bacterium]|nr:hypothetical protein [Gemmatimonadales bacterium]
MKRNVAAARVDTGPWETFPRPITGPRRERRVLGEGRTGRVRVYYLLDASGRRLGVIVGPESRPGIGRHAPTVYLRRM